MNRDPLMSLRIFEALPRSMLEFYYNENGKNPWVVPGADEVKEQAKKLAP
jgi:hypothetical protein